MLMVKILKTSTGDVCYCYHSIATCFKPSFGQIHKKMCFKDYSTNEDFEKPLTTLQMSLFLERQHNGKPSDVMKSSFLQSLQKAPGLLANAYRPLSNSTYKTKNAYLVQNKVKKEYEMLNILLGQQSEQINDMLQAKYKCIDVIMPMGQDTNISLKMFKHFMEKCLPEYSMHKHGVQAFYHNFIGIEGVESFSLRTFVTSILL